MKGKYIRRGLSLCAALLMIGTFVSCGGGGTESGASNDSDASSNRVVELPAIDVKNPVLKVLTHDAQTMGYAEATLKDTYGITDVQITTVAPAESGPGCSMRSCPRIPSTSIGMISHLL